MLRMVPLSRFAGEERVGASGAPRLRGELSAKPTDGRACYPGFPSSPRFLSNASDVGSRPRKPT